MTRFLSRLLLAACAVPLTVGPALAAWPYLTEEASTLGAGNYALSMGVGRTEIQDQFRQFGVALTPAEGTLWSLPEVEARLGLGTWAEVMARYQVYYFEPSDDGDERVSSGDLRLWTKILLASPGPARLSGRFGVKAPVASNRDGLGTDEADFFVSLLGDLDLGPVELSGNAGLAVLGDPTKSQSQDDLVTWAGSVRVPLGTVWSAGVEASGQKGPFGVDRERELATLAGVLTWKRGRWRADVAGRRGIGDAESWGWIAGLTCEAR